MTKISRSPDRYSFQARSTTEMLRANPDDEAALEELAEHETWKEERFRVEETPGWAVHNLEYDLRTTDWILEKARADEVYAQQLYAAMCNNNFRKNEVWPTLMDDMWSCSWRAAGGIIANMLQKGDYTDWYCSGIFIDDELTDAALAGMSVEDREKRLRLLARVTEGVVTDEIQSDLFVLGWVVIPD